MVGATKYWTPCLPASMIMPRIPPKAVLCSRCRSSICIFLALAFIVLDEMIDPKRNENKYHTRNTNNGQERHRYLSMKLGLATLAGEYSTKSNLLDPHHPILHP